MKKFLLLFAALLTLGVTARAADGDEFTVDNLKYQVLSEADHEVSIKGYVTKPEGDLVIPSFVSNKSSRYFVTLIGSSAFSDCLSLTSVTIPNSVTEIGRVAFSRCSSLTSVTIPNSVTEIGEYAFSGCDSLTSVTIPNSVTYIGTAPFGRCSSLEEILVEEGNTEYTSEDGVLFNNGITTLIQCPGAKKSSYAIPNSVTAIGRDAFSGCSSLTSVTIPNSVIEIGKYAFSGCSSLTSVTIPNSVIEIGWYAFSGCSSLTSVTIPNSVTEIGIMAFSYCTGLTSVTIPNSVTKIENSAFFVCTSLTTIYALPTTPPSSSNDSFRHVPETAVVYIPKGSFKAYFVADGWSHFTDFREMGALDITLSESNISIEEGETATLTATVTKDDDVTVTSETWSTSNPEVATIADGVVVAVGEGTATITYTVVDGYGVPHTESCEVKVSSVSAIENITANDSGAPAEFFNLNGVRVNGEALTPGLYIKRQGGKATKVLVK